MNGTTKCNANLRSGPGTQFNPPLATLTAGTTVTIVGTEGEWLQVRANGSEGFIRKDLLILDQEEVREGFLIHDPDFPSWNLPPDRLLTPPPGCGQAQKTVCRIWNRFGGIIGCLSERLKIDPGLAVAVVATESGGAGFSADRMIIRFENHYFWDLWGKKNQEAYADHFAYDKEKRWLGHRFRDPKGALWIDFHGKQELEWKVFAKALELDQNAAMSSISMGLPQIMGSNHGMIGYESPKQMYDSFSADEKPQIIGLFDFVQGPHKTSPGLLALQRKDLVAFAAFYNGKGQATRYGAVLQGYWEGFAGMRS